MIRVSVYGATGYAGIELVRLLSIHPEVKIVHLISKNFAGRPLQELYPSFFGFFEKNCSDTDMETVAADSDVIFTALPHGVSSEVVPFFYKLNKKVIDLSGDFRYKSPEVYKIWYGMPHPHPDLLKVSVYGLPEIHRKLIKGSQIVGNPGCYTTCSILGMAPLVAEKIIDLDSIIIDAKSGATGAGRNPSQDLHFCEVDENIKAYKVAVHRHTSEIEQELSLLAGRDISLSFTPHLLPVKRGILCTMYASIKNLCTEDYIYSIYKEFYKDEPFIYIYPKGKLPELKFVNGSNACHIGFVVDKRLNRIIVVSAIDNLIKGAAGQAIQNMNILFGLDETTGLNQPGWYL